MRGVIYVLTALAVIGSGFWAYRENYATQAEIDRVAALSLQIGRARERLAILEAEWAYLNRPDRLRHLADMNFDRLGLLALRAEQFSTPRDVVPAAPVAGILPEGVTDVTSAGIDR